MAFWSELTTFGRFVRGVPALVGTRVDAEVARAIVGRRLAEREQNFLAGLERSVFANRGSPYRRLMRWAGCEPDDVRALVRERGLEGTLRALKESGIYITFEEFKGRVPIVRGSQQLDARPTDFDNPTFRRYYAASTGGSTGPPRRVLMDLDFLESRKPIHAIMMEAHGLTGAPMAQWAEIPPGHGLEAALLQTAQDGNLERWFTPIWTGRSGPGLRFCAATKLVVAVARRHGAPMPEPEHLPLDRAHVVVRWAQATLRQHGRCAIRAHVSKALRIAIAAQELGVDLTGTTITSGGEPPTAAKVRMITATGARLITNYFFMEAGPIGLGCARPSDPNDQHFMKDHLAVVACARNVPSFDLTVNAFYYTTLLPTAPKVMLNVETDDYGVCEERSCGCLLDELGFTTHLREIRSFSKLSGEGVTLIGSEMERILDDVLPSLFGGSPLDYQLVEEEDDQGFTRLTLLVHPGVVLADENEVVAAIHQSLARTGGAADVSRTLWSQAGTIRIRREEPRLNAAGKLWPLHSQRRRNATPEGVKKAATPVDGSTVHPSNR